MSRIIEQLKYLWGQTYAGKRARLRFMADYLIIQWDNLVEDRGLPERAYTPQWGVLDRIGRLSCFIVGHDSTVDDCAMPEHDYCMVCHKLTPGAAQRPGKRHVTDRDSRGYYCLNCSWPDGEFTSRRADARRHERVSP